ncbi:MAG: response regulator [Chloroflexi bacterium]|nr:response regulator [Chloroflexota bacterium]
MVAEVTSEPPPILLVEDNPDDVLLTRRALARQGLETAVVKDGIEALDFLFAEGRFADRAASRLPRFVLLDLKLPKVAGLEVLRRLRSDARTRGLPVVVFTSSGEERDLVEAFERGANSYVRKPIDSIQFGSVLRDLGHYWLTVNEATPERA